MHEGAPARIGDLQQLEMIAGQYATREQFVTELTLDPPQVTSDLSGAPHLDDDFVILSTIHSAKGQESDSVYFVRFKEAIPQLGAH